MKALSTPRFPAARLGLVTLAALLIHGYHLGVEDGEIYIPAARKLLQTDLYPFGSEFFLSHEGLSLFAPIVAGSARLAHISLDWSVFFWYLITLFATIAGCWTLAAAVFHSSRARWSAVLVMAAVMTMPATNTGLLLVDPYITARSFSTPLSLFALTAFALGHGWIAVALMLATASIHPQMAAYLVFLAAILAWRERATSTAPQPAPVVPAILVALPSAFRVGAAPEPYREALYARSYFFLSTWTWYHWLGMLAPLAFLLWFARGRIHKTSPAFSRISLALIPFGFVSIAAAALISSSHQFDMFARLQPLRSFHLITLVFILFLAGVTGEYVADKRIGLVPALCLLLAAGMFFVERATYPHSPHIELPGATSSSNDWVNALLWIRRNTPSDAVFAVDSRYFLVPGVDVHGFRAISGRSALADYFKDSGAVSIFPALAPEWKRMSDATHGLNMFAAPDFERLAREYPVSWTLIHGVAPTGMKCPYQQRGYAICEIAPAAMHSAQAE
jgi:hypothetical protein